MKTPVSVAFLVVLFVCSVLASPTSPVVVEADPKSQSPSFSTFPAGTQTQDQPIGQTYDSYSNVKPQIQPPRPSTGYTGPVPDAQAPPSTWQQHTPSDTKDSKPVM